MKHSERDRLAIWGASGHALVVADIVRLAGVYDIAGYVDDVNPDCGRTLNGLPIWGGKHVLDSLREASIGTVILAFGNCEARLRIAERVKSAGMKLGRAVHPRAVVAVDVDLGAGTVVAAGAIINPGACVGENVIVNTGATVDHECRIHDGAHICPGSHLAGGVTVGRAAWVGIGSTVIERISIGASSMIGAGSVVTDHIPDGVLAYGVPARVVKRIVDEKH